MLYNGDHLCHQLCPARPVRGLLPQFPPYLKFVSPLIVLIYLSGVTANQGFYGVQFPCLTLNWMAILNRTFELRRSVYLFYSPSLPGTLRAVLYFPHIGQAGGPRLTLSDPLFVDQGKYVSRFQLWHLADKTMAPLLDLNDRTELVCKT